MKKLKRAVIREELVELTGDYKLAIVLNQLIYWSQFVEHFVQYIEEEKKRRQYLEVELCNGWIYKSADELTHETMMNVSVKTMRHYLRKLVGKEWIQERDNPRCGWDHTKQYRVNLVKLQMDLYRIGYVLQDYKVDLKIFVPPEQEEKTKEKIDLLKHPPEQEETKETTDELKPPPEIVKTKGTIIFSKAPSKQVQSKGTLDMSKHPTQSERKGTSDMSKHPTQSERKGTLDMSKHSTQSERNELIGFSKHAIQGEACTTSNGKKAATIGDNARTIPEIIPEINNKKEINKAPVDQPTTQSTTQPTTQSTTQSTTEIIQYLNDKTRKHFKANTRKTKQLIQARRNEGFTIDDFKRVIDNKCNDWLHDKKMNKYLRPETLFGSKFDSYLNELVKTAGEREFEAYLKDGGAPPTLNDSNLEENPTATTYTKTSCENPITSIRGATTYTKENPLTSIRGAEEVEEDG